MKTKVELEADLIDRNTQIVILEAENSDLKEFRDSLREKLSSSICTGAGKLEELEEAQAEIKDLKLTNIGLAKEILQKDVRIGKLENRLSKAEAFVEQGRAMVESVMDRWHEYDD